MSNPAFLQVSFLQNKMQTYNIPCRFTSRFATVDGQGAFLCCAYYFGYLPFFNKLAQTLTALTTPCYLPRTSGSRMQAGRVWVVLLLHVAITEAIYSGGRARGRFQRASLTGLSPQCFSVWPLSPPC